MSRFGRPRRRLRRSSRTKGDAQLVDLVMVPGQEHQLSDGVVVRARLVARLLGMRLLRVDADVVLAPGTLERSRRPTPPIAELTGQAPLRPAPVAGSAGSGLGVAAKFLDEADGALESARTTAEVS